MQIKKSVMIATLAILLLVPLASAGFFDFITGRSNSPAPTNVTAQILSSQPTMITSVGVPVSFTPEEDGIKNVTVTFTAEDLDGSTDVDVNSGSVSISTDCPYNGPTTRTSISCVNTTAPEVSTPAISFTCEVPLKYFDCAGSWVVNVSVNYHSPPETAYNYTVMLLVNPTYYVSIYPSDVSFPTMIVGDSNVASSVDNFVNTTGNTIPDLNLTAQDLNGVVNNADIFPANNFTALATSGPNACAAAYLIDNSDVIVANSSLGLRPLLDTDVNSDVQTEVKYCIPLVPQLPAQNYTTYVGTSTPWMITAFNWNDE